MIRSKYAINLSLDDLYQIREAFKLNPPAKDGVKSNLPGKINKSIVILEGLKKRGDKRDDKRLQGAGTTDLHKRQRLTRKMEPTGSKQT